MDFTLIICESYTLPSTQPSN